MNVLRQLGSIPLSICTLLFTVITSTLAQPVGTAYVAGTTWYDMQHAGSCGRMVAVDDAGNVQVAWMRSDAGITNRHVYRNEWSPQAGRFLLIGGEQVDDAMRGGFVTLALTNGGCPIYACHRLMSSDPYHTWTAVFPCSDSSFVPPVEALHFQLPVWPIVSSDLNGRIHLLTIGVDHDDIYLNYYGADGLASYDSAGHCTDIAWTTHDGDAFERIDEYPYQDGHCVASSRVSSRVVRSWFRQDGYLSMNNDVMLQVADDGEMWGPVMNISKFDTPDTCDHNLSGYVFCSRDSLRAANSLDLLIDDRNTVHEAFVTVNVARWEMGYPETGYDNSRSLLWCWNENTTQFGLIANGWELDTLLGENQRAVCRPTLSIDESTGYLYCAYLRFDSTQRSMAGYAMADVFVSVSTDGGSNWSVGTNVTRTRPTVLPAPTGQSLSEREPTLADRVTNGFLHLSYVLDHDAGSATAYNREGDWTSNDFIYQRIPVDSIPTTPLVPPYPLHYDSSGFPMAAHPIEHHRTPDVFALHPAYPNPFNNQTRIAFELPRAMQVELKVYDVLGRTVDVLQTGRLAAGDHDVNWDATRFASGVYFVSLSSRDISRVQKVVLLK